MDRIKVELTHALVSVDHARNHYRDHGCDDQLPRLILDAKEHVDAARDAIFARARAIKRPDYLPDDDYPDLIPGFTDAADEDTLSDIVREVIRVGLKKKERRVRRGK